MNSPRLEISPSLTMSTPAATCRATTSATAAGSAASKDCLLAGTRVEEPLQPLGPRQHPGV